MRDQIRYFAKRDRERNQRLDFAGKKKSKAVRDRERDFSERIALGIAQPTKNELMFDQRLFNQTSGLGSGFGHDEDYNIYDKPMFADRTATQIYSNVKNIQDEEEEDEN